MNSKHYILSAREELGVESVGLAQQPLDAVAANRLADAPRNGKT